MLVEDGGPQPGHVVAAPHVDHMGPGPAPVALDGGHHGGGAVGIDLGDLHLCTVRREEPADGPADAVTTTGDDRHLPVEESLPVVDPRNAVGRLLAHGAYRTAHAAAG